MYLSTAVQMKAASWRFSASILPCLCSINKLQEVSSTLSFFPSFRWKREFKILELQSQCRLLLDFLGLTPIFLLAVMTICTSPAKLKQYIYIISWSLCKVQTFHCSSLRNDIILFCLNMSLVCKTVFTKIRGFSAHGRPVGSYKAS